MGRNQPLTGRIPPQKLDNGRVLAIQDTGHGGGEAGLRRGQVSLITGNALQQSCEAVVQSRVSIARRTGIALPA